MSSTAEPDLRSGVTDKQALSDGIVVLIDLISASFDVNRHEFAIVFRSKLRTNIPLVDSLSALGKYFFAITGLWCSRGFSPQGRLGVIVRHHDLRQSLELIV